jgi:hypothetical protein
MGPFDRLRTGPFEMRSLDKLGMTYLDRLRVSPAAIG